MNIYEDFADVECLSDVQQALSELESYGCAISIREHLNDSYPQSTVWDDAILMDPGEMRRGWQLTLSAQTETHFKEHSVIPRCSASRLALLRS